jgi:hypothetical protein
MPGAIVKKSRHVDKSDASIAMYIKSHQSCELVRSKLRPENKTKSTSEKTEATLKTQTVKRLLDIISPRERLLQRPRLLNHHPTKRSENRQKLRCLEPTLLLPKRRRPSLLHSKLIARVQQSVRVLRRVSNAHLHCDGHGKEDVETGHRYGDRQVDGRGRVHVLA